MAAHVHQLTIRTPEGVSFSLPLAGPISRCMAWLMDAAAIMAVMQVLRSLTGIFGILGADISGALSIILFFVVYIGYAMVLEWLWQGQTLGKRLMGLRVMDIRGLRLNPSQIILRNLLRAVDSLPLFYLLGGIVSIINRHAQRLGDLAANTIVIKEVKAVPPDLDLIIEKNLYNSLSDYPHLVARLRQAVTPEEAGLALQTLMRRDALAPDARVALFRKIEAHFKSKVTFPEEALAGTASEQYVRNVVDVLFRSPTSLSSHLSSDHPDQSLPRT